jgi:hypothetical protein
LRFASMSLTRWMRRTELQSTRRQNCWSMPFPSNLKI